MHSEDAEFILRLLNTQKWKQYVSDRGIDTNEKAIDFLEASIIPSYDKLGFGFYLIEKKEDHEAVGICGLVRREGLDDIDIGYALLPEYEGNGFALEAAQATLEWGFTTHHLTRILAITDQKNTQSISLLKKLGMNFTGLVQLPSDAKKLMLFSLTK